MGALVWAALVSAVSLWVLSIQWRESMALTYEVIEWAITAGMNRGWDGKH